MGRRKKPVVKPAYNVLISHTSSYDHEIRTVASIHDLLTLVHEKGCSIIVSAVGKYSALGYERRGINPATIDFAIEVYDDYRE